MYSCKMESADPIECKIELTGSEDEDDTSRHYERYNSIREKLLYNMSKLQQRGPFMTAGMIGGSNIDPGLHVPSLGTVKVPISEDNAKALIQSAKVCGKRSE